MPFNPPLHRPFSESSVRESAPAPSGVYGVSNTVEWLSVGETDNIQEALLRHLRESDTGILECRANGFVLERFASGLHGAVARRAWLLNIGRGCNESRGAEWRR
jgi:hypothetical protein